MIKELKQRNLFHLKHFKLYEDRFYYKNKVIGSLPQKLMIHQAFKDLWQLQLATL